MPLKIISGSSHKNFARKIFAHLGIAETKITSKIFSNENRFVTIDEAVRGDDMFVIQTQATPVDSHVMELLILIRTLRDASAERITVVMPYFPYARSDKKDQPRVCIAARLLADMIEKAGANRILTMELHSPQIQGFFSIPCDHLLAAPDIIKFLKQNWNLTNCVLVAGDSGAVKMIKPYADNLNLPTAVMDKRREGNDETVRIKGVIGEVRNKNVLLLDDETTSGGTLVENAEYLTKQAGALKVDACFIHPTFNDKGVEKLNNSPIQKFLFTDTIPLNGKPIRNYEIISVAKRFAEMIKRIHDNESVKSLNDV
ncbi:MAG: ribose-phosphate pyrophosphokinase [Candidatus Magasanikbacteria bacterium]|nr:ribose-phosphate pyrophosphokinase [Candidatus Magasanikbacteria bacterium]